MKNVIVCTMGVAVLLAMTCVAGADPWPGRDVLKFSQRPMIDTMIPTDLDAGGVFEDVIYYGHDELSTAWDTDPDGQEVYNGFFMADDFADTFDTPVVHVRWWGSYMSRPADGERDVQRFLIAFENDIPAVLGREPYPFSHPDCVYDDDNPPHVQFSVRDMSGVTMPQPGMFTETLVPGSNPNEPVYEYNAELLNPFPQEEDTVYWLKIVALVDNDPQETLKWGWHNRDYTIKNDLASPAADPGERDQSTGSAVAPTAPIWHFQDNAVSGTIDGIYYDASKDFIHMDQDHYGDSLKAELYKDFDDGPEGIGQYSKDLAFELFTVPEPSTLTLLALGGLLLLVRRFRK